MSGEGYLSRYYSAPDGLRLHYREYGDALRPGTPILCLPGLVRNSVDFHEFALRHADSHRVLAPDLRGRGLSAYHPDYRKYHPLTYAIDITALLTLTNCHSAVVVGTSLGGIMAMALATIAPTALAAVVLNDIGPDVDNRGIERIRSYVGKPITSMTVEEAAKAQAEQFGQAFPDYTNADWLAEVRRTYKVGEDGRVALNYDPGISRAMAEQTADTPDLWPYFRALRHVPVLSLRGERSDILAKETVARMAEEHGNMRAVEVPDRGHTPTLGEPMVVKAIEELLQPFRARHD